MSAISMSVQRSTRPFFLILSAILLAACSPRAATEVPTSAPTHTATNAPTLTPTLELTATIEPTATVPAIDPNSNFPAGKFLWSNGSYFTFTQDGRWSHAADEGPAFATGRFRVEGDTYTQLSHSEGCPTPMRYEFTFDGTTLTFRLTEQSQDDPCADRRSIYDNQAYILAP